MKLKLAMIALMVGVTTDFALAQEGPGKGRRGRPDSAEGQPGGPGDQRGGPRRLPPFIAALDTNKDGIIDAAEMAAAPTSLKTLDTNNDGVISTDELHPKRGPGGPGAAPGGPGPGKGPEGDQRGNRPLPPILAALDANQDGTIDATELANASAALKQLDKNQDGQLTAEELHPGRGQGGPGRRPGRGAEAPAE